MHLMINYFFKLDDSRCKMFSVSENLASISLGLAIRRARKTARLTLRELASAIDVSIGTASAIENGKVSVSVARLRMIATVLGVDVQDFFSGAHQESTEINSLTKRRSGRGYEPGLLLDSTAAAAIEVFDETGYYGATMRQVAAAANMSVAGIYHHYRSKQAILVSLFDILLVGIQNGIQNIISDDQDRAASFLAVVESITIFQQQNSALVRVVNSELRSVMEPDRTRIEQVCLAIFRQIRARAELAKRISGVHLISPDQLVAAVLYVTEMSFLVPHQLESNGPLSMALAETLLTKSKEVQSI